MKVGVIGLGAIAQKAYLPLLAAKGDLDIVLATRNPKRSIGLAGNTAYLRR
jgi:virulence factor